MTSNDSSFAEPTPSYNPYAGLYYGQPDFTAPIPPQYGQQAYGYPSGGPQPGVRPRRAVRGRRLMVAGAAAVTAAAVVAGVTVAESNAALPGRGSVGALGGTTGGSSGGGSGAGSGGILPGGTVPNGSPGGSTGGGSTGGGSTGGSTGAASAALATTAQQRGVVTIVSVLDYGVGESAGTGMVLTANGEILTNNHVINGASSITVTVVSTKRSYRADVVGTDASDDVAVLKLRSASGLQTAELGDSSDVRTGDAVTGVGNAGGTGTLRASAGKVTALAQSITASDEQGADSERLHGLIEVDAPIISGDSGGPMYDAAGEVIGMNTAASTSQSTGPTAGTSATTAAYAIPIDTAMSLADKIETGVQTTTIRIGLPAFIGVSVAPDTGSAAAVSTVLAGGPAARAGISAGSVITGVGTTKVASAAALKAALRAYKPGSTVRLSWTGSDGAGHTASVTTVAGPAD